MSRTPLTPDERRELESRLRDRQRALRDELKVQLSGSDDPNVVGLRNRLADTDDWAVADALSELDIAIVSRDLAELANVQAALRRLADGEYGRCADCGEAIPFARLTANPSSTRCVSCQEIRERRNGAG
jgi:phage/conjugal plasmid C-4 type zinc finger TraR family protein